MVGFKDGVCAPHRNFIIGFVVDFILSWNILSIKMNVENLYFHNAVKLSTSLLGSIEKEFMIALQSQKEALEY